MNRKKSSTQRLTLAAFFVAIEMVLTMTQLGYLPIGPISITTMHLPVILAGIVLGPAYGAGIGLVFGLTSVYNATFRPGLTSFCFSPFISVGEVSGNMASLLIAIGPRVLLGCASAVLYRWIRKKTGNTVLSASISAGVNTLVHTLAVMGLIVLFFGDAYSSAVGIPIGSIIAVVISTNGIWEILLAVIAIGALTRALKPYQKESDV